ncbi:MAG: DUF1835 domain-containing protein [Bacteroidetes bacterium]|nr:MAG: DUF1835 domain-containing protein [Bacteroidota bacterium]TAE67194.1 MAG: DUF1835 domain-containing protein [Bacteroidota bacterium]TAF93980.1 MAG: DUF1835 domain-containing protein [Bacteroidota bacterium]
MMHIVFQPADKEVLEKAQAISTDLAGDIVVIEDDFAVGPLFEIGNSEGFADRKQWWAEILEHSPYVDRLDIVNDAVTVHKLVQALQNGEQVCIWAAQNAHDVCGYYWLVSQLQPYQGNVHIVFLNNLPFINEKGGIFYPQYLFEIQPSEFRKAVKLTRAITPSEFEVDIDEYKKMCTHTPTDIRVLEGGKKIGTKPVHHFDAILYYQLTDEPQKLSKILQQVLQKQKQTALSDVMLVSRLKEMAKNGTIALHGSLEKGWKDVLFSLPFQLTADIPPHAPEA